MPYVFEHAPAVAPPARAKPARRGSPQPADDLRAKALKVHRRLSEVFGPPVPDFHSLDLLSELVSSPLSHRTRNAELGRAFKALNRGRGARNGRPYRNRTEVG